MEISFERLLGLFFNKLKFILLVAVIATIATYFISDNLIEKKYTSTSQMNVPTITTGSASSGDIINTRRLVTEYVDILSSLDFFEAAAESVEEQTGLSYTKSQLRSSTSIASKSSGEHSSVFYIRFTSDSPEKAQTVLKIIDETAIDYIAERYKDANKEGVARKLGFISINESPNAPTSPSSPNILNNCIGAFVIAFIVSACLFYFREILDDRIKNVRDIISEYDIPLLGVVPDFIQEQPQKRNKKTYHSYTRVYADKSDKEETK